MYRGINKGVSGLKCHIFIYFVYVWVGGVCALHMCGRVVCVHHGAHVWMGGVCAPWCTCVDGWCAYTVVHTCGWWCAYTRVHMCGWVVCVHCGAHVEVKGFILLLRCGSQRPLPSSGSVVSALPAGPSCLLRLQVLKGQKKMRCLHCFIKSSSESY